MPEAWQSVGVTGVCMCLTEGVLLLPQPTAIVPPRAAVRKDRNSATSIVRTSRRSDAGTAACAPPGLLVSLGGENATIEWRPADFNDRLRYDRSLQLPLVLAGITAIGTVITAVLSFLNSTGPAWIATGTLFVATVLATATLVGDISKSD